VNSDESSPLHLSPLQKDELKGGFLGALYTRGGVLRGGVRITGGDESDGITGVTTMYDLCVHGLPNFASILTKAKSKEKM
jgi:hypothetical protein